MQEPELLTDEHLNSTPVCFRSDAKKLIYYASGIFELDLDTRAVTPLVDTPEENVAFGDLSLNDQWLVYLTTAANHDYEVFIRRYPEMDQSHRVSRFGGLDPMWSRANKNTIFFWNGGIPYGKVMAATISFDPFEVLGVEPAVDETSLDLLGYAFDYDAKNDRFLLVRPAGEFQPPTEIRWLRNVLSD